MRRPGARARYAAAAMLVAAAAALSAAAVPAAHAAGAAVPFRPAAPASAPAPARRPVAATLTHPTLRAPGHLLGEARVRLRAGRNDPATEVDRWAVHLATDAASNAALRRYARYRRLIEGELASRGLPLDLAFVPWVESEWRPEATSRAGAAGLWQLMPATARAYGLEVSAYVDERRDPVRSTTAAVRHLADLYAESHDWHTTLAAYNAGSGRTASVRGRFWSRRRSLPAETRAYVPRVLAAARVGREPAAWGLEPAPAPPLLFRQVWAPAGTPLDTVADRLRLPRTAVRELNPHLTHAMTPPGRRWPVRVPAGPTPAGPRSDPKAAR